MKSRKSATCLVCDGTELVYYNGDKKRYSSEASSLNVSQPDEQYSIHDFVNNRKILFTLRLERVDSDGDVTVWEYTDDNYDFTFWIFND